MSPRAATAVIFLVHGTIVGSWLAQIPYVQNDLEMSQATVGIVLLSLTAGSLGALVAGGQLVSRLGSLRPTRAASIAFCLLLPVPLLAPSVGALMASLALFGVAAGLMDVSMNAHAVAVERALGRPVLSSLHAMFSLGGLVGAGATALSATAGAPPRAHVVVTAVLALVLALVAVRSLGPGEPVAARRGIALLARPSRAALALGGLSLLVLLAEGAMEGWTGLYLDDELGTATSTAAIGYAGFALGMTVGRLVGDRLAERFGAVALLCSGTALAAVSLVAALLAGHPAVAVAGFAAVGLGVANAFPLFVSLAGRGSEATGPSVSAVAGLGYLGFLVGPPLIGFVAEGLGLPVALGLVAAGLAAVAVAAAPVTRPIEAAAPRGAAAP